MAVDTLEPKAHELLGQLNPVKLAAVVHLLEVVIDDDIEDSDTLSPAEAKADEWSKNNSAYSALGSSRRVWAFCGRLGEDEPRAVNSLCINGQKHRLDRPGQGRLRAIEQPVAMQIERVLDRKEAYR